MKAQIAAARRHVGAQLCRRGEWRWRRAARGRWLAMGFLPVVAAWAVAARAAGYCLPFGVAVSPDGQFVYVTHLDSSVSVVDAATSTIAATISVGVSGEAVGLSPNGAVAVVYAGRQSVVLIDTATRTVSATIAVAFGSGVSAPSGIAFTPDGAFAYVASGSLSVIDTSAHTVVTTIPLDSSASGIAVSPDGALVYVTHPRTNMVSVIDTSTNRVTDSIPVGHWPIDVVVSPDGAFAYVLNSPPLPPIRAPRFPPEFVPVGDVSVIDAATRTVVATITVGRGSFDIALSPDGRFAYVANFASRTLSVVDTGSRSIASTITLPRYFGPFGVAVSPDGTVAYATADKKVYVIDTATNTLRSTITLCEDGAPPTPSASPTVTATSTALPTNAPTPTAEAPVAGSPTGQRGAAGDGGCAITAGPPGTGAGAAVLLVVLRALLRSGPRTRLGRQHGRGAA